MHGFIPISMQDAAAYGTFNAQAANDPVLPYAWRDDPPAAQRLFDPAHPLTDVALHSKLIHLAVSYVGSHPLSLAEAFFWNGLSRLWDVRRRSRSLLEVPFEGRDRTVPSSASTSTTCCCHWRWSVCGAPAADARSCSACSRSRSALRSRSRSTGDAVRAPLEPLIAVLACAGVLGAREAPATAA